MSRIQTGEVTTNLNDELPDVKLFWVEVVPDQLAKITKFIIIGQAPTEYTPMQHRKLVTRSVNYQMIA